MQANITLTDYTLTVGTFGDLKKFIQHLNYNDIKGLEDSCIIHKLIIINPKCNESIDNIRSFLKHEAFKYLMDIEITNPDERFCSINGLLYSRNKRRLYACPSGISGVLKIPDGTDTICEFSCYESNFQEVEIPDSVKRIEQYAFSRTWMLEKIAGGNNVERIGDYAFSRCIYLKSFPFSNKLKSIGDGSFENTSLKKVYLPEGLISVGRQAFNTTCIKDGYQTYVEADDMYDINIPKSLRYIGFAAFANAKNVQTQSVSKELIAACVRNGNLYHCYKCNVWNLKINDAPAISLPKSIVQAKTVVYEIQLFLQSDSNIPPELYMYSTDSTSLSVAIKQCSIYPSAKLKGFITRNIKTIVANTMLEENGEQLMIEFIKSGIFTETALKRILSELEKSENPQDAAVLKAYILNTMKHEKKSFNL